MTKGDKDSYIYKETYRISPKYGYTDIINIYIQYKDTESIYILYRYVKKTLCISFARPMAHEEKDGIWNSYSLYSTEFRKSQFLMCRF